jgi:hypothetical protein
MIDATVLSLYLSALYFSFQFLPLAKIIERMENGKSARLLVNCFGGEDNLRERFPKAFKVDTDFSCT